MGKGSGGTRRSTPGGSVGAKQVEGSVLSKHPRWNRVYKQIESILQDITTNGHSTSEQIFSIGEADNDMRIYAITNGIPIASVKEYMDSQHIFHAQRSSHRNDGIYVGDQALKNFPKDRYNMSLFYDLQNSRFVYTDYTNKFIVDSSLKPKKHKDMGEVALFVTGYKVSDANEFNNVRRYVRIRP